MSNQKVYEAFTEKIVAMLDAGELPPWRKPWNAGAAAGPDGFCPRNAASNRPYRGVNVWWLLMAAQTKGYTRNLWLTYRQAKKLGGYVRKGEKSETVILWKPAKGKDKTDADGNEEKGRRYLLLRTYRVFNVEQCEGLPEKFQPVDEPEEPEAETEIEVDERAEKIVADYVAREDLTLRHGGVQAYYHKRDDYVQVPPRDSFDSMGGYYSVVFHELGHSTGHTKRLNRESLTKTCMFGDHTYSREELVAEFTAAFLCGVTGVSMPALVQNQAAYLKHWAALLRNEPKILINAAAQAQKAADRILDHDPSVGAKGGDDGDKAEDKPAKPAKKKATKARKPAKKKAAKGKKKAPPRVTKRRKK